MRESDDEGDDNSNSKSYENDHKHDDSQDNKRLKKNRESARNSRQRKKIYIDLLEKKHSILQRSQNVKKYNNFIYALMKQQVSELTQEIDEVCVFIEKSQSNISTILSHNPFFQKQEKKNVKYYNKLRGLVQERLNFLEKIQKHINEPKPNEDELNLVVDSFRVKFYINLI